jgi:hypothetical protein
LETNNSRRPVPPATSHPQRSQRDKRPTLNITHLVM